MKITAQQNSRSIGRIKIPQLISVVLFFTALLLVKMFLSSLVSCSKVTTIISPPIPKPTTTISGISPERAPLNTVFSIFGNHFGTDLNVIQVFFNQAEAEVQTVSNTQIKTVVPVSVSTGFVKLIVKGSTITGPEFIYVLSLQVSTLVGSLQGFADGNGTNAQFYNPIEIMMDTERNVYVADTQNHKMRKITAK